MCDQEGSYKHTHTISSTMQCELVGFYIEALTHEFVWEVVIGIVLYIYCLSDLQYVSIA